MNIAITRVFLAVSMLSIIAFSAALYLDIINKQQTTSYNDLNDVLGKSMDKALIKGDSRIVNLKLSHAKVSPYTLNTKLRIYFQDIDIDNEEIKQFLSNFLTVYQADVAIQGVRVQTDTPPPFIKPSNSLILVNSTSISRENRLVISYSDGKSYYIIPRLIITVEKNPLPGNNNYTLIITVPKLILLCQGGCNTLSGFYDIYIKTDKIKVTPIPYDVSIPWVNGHQLKASLEGASSEAPVELFGVRNLVSINGYSQLHILVQVANFTLVFHQTG